MAETWIPREEFVETLPRALHGCGVLLFDPDGKLLLLHNSYSAGRTAKGWPQRWWAPGGLLDAGEIPEQAARREVAEETGLDLEGVLRPVGVDFLPPAEGWPPVSTYFFSTWPLTREQADSVVLSEAHDQHRFLELADWEREVSATMYARLTALVLAVETGRQVVLHCGRPM
ncbi:NUDIX domain-containing protein [Kitasatospora sp. NPDC088134]|uniref:NUDIX domain-containing protein n=1 Tax=Kitasatospora sp. NPDC088134 TaxID=3364071 RepID=UPI00381D073C